MSAHAKEQPNTYGQQSKPRFRPTQYYFDIACWAVAILAAYLIYYDFSLTPSTAVLVVVLVVVAALAQLAFGWAAFLFRFRYSAGSFDEIRALLKTGFAIGLTMVIANLIAGYTIDHPVTVSEIGRARCR